MLLKTVHQWDIRNQEDLDIFSAESLEIHLSAARTLYRTDPEADPGQSRKRAEERAGKSTQRRTGRVRRKPNETPEQLQKRTEKGKKKIPPSPVKEEPEEQLEEEWTPMICIRAEFLERLARHQELRNRRESGRNDGYSIVVKAVVERRDGNVARAEFVETEGPRLAHLVDPNGGRILEWFPDGYGKQYDEDFIPVAEDTDGNIVPAEEWLKTSQDIRRNTQRMLVHQDLDQQEELLLIALMGGSDYCNKDFYCAREWIEGEHRSDLTHLMEEQKTAGA
jgi:hypothetical protein